MAKAEFHIGKMNEGVITETHPSLLFLDFDNRKESEAKLIAAEKNRVQFYVREYPVYKAKGIKLLFPDKVQPELVSTTQAIDMVDQAVRLHITKDYKYYAEISRLFQQDWQELVTRGLWKVTNKVMGDLPRAERTLLPTAWGTGGSSWGKDTDGYNEIAEIFGEGIIFVRIDSYNNVQDAALERKRLIVHEFAAHAVTAPFRMGTPIEDEVARCSHQQDKEWLMDEITAQLLTNLGYYNHLKEAPRKEMTQQAADLTRHAFYINPFDSNPRLKYPGDIGAVFQEVTEALQQTDSSSLSKNI